jgi:hypothetical protein
MTLAKKINLWKKLYRHQNEKSEFGPGSASKHDVDSQHFVVRLLVSRDLFVFRRRKSEKPAPLLSHSLSSPGELAAPAAAPESAVPPALPSVASAPALFLPYPPLPDSPSGGQHSSGSRSPLPEFSGGQNSPGARPPLPESSGGQQSPGPRPRQGWNFLFKKD